MNQPAPRNGKAPLEAGGVYVNHRQGYRIPVRLTRQNPAQLTRWSAEVVEREGGHYPNPARPGQTMSLLDGNIGDLWPGEALPSEQRRLDEEAAASAEAARQQALHMAAATAGLTPAGLALSVGD